MQSTPASSEMDHAEFQIQFYIINSIQNKHFDILTKYHD